MDRDLSLTREVRAILRSPAFMRSPSLSKVLDYLLSRELSADGTPTQYDIAVGAMGKSSDFNEITDSAVRVQMSRLRKALSDYYLLHAPQDGLYIHIRVGEYRLRSASLEVAYPDLAAAKQAKTEPSTLLTESNSSQTETEPTETLRIIPRPIKDDVRRDEPTWNKSLLVLSRLKLPAVVLLALLTGWWLINKSMDVTQTSRAGLSVPYVAANLDFSELQGSNTQQAYLEARLSSDVRTLLQKSLISRYSHGELDRDADYFLLIDLTQSQDGQYGAEVVLTDKENRVITERTLRAEYTASDLLDALQEEMTSVISPAGHITRDLAKNLTSEPENDFECFLAVETSRAQGDMGDQLVDRCIEEYPDGEFTPYIRVRRAFVMAQTGTLSGQNLSPSDPAWLEVSSVLEQHPDNAYANALAAKFLIASGKCSQAAGFAREGFSRGRTYPALELAVIVDAYGCDEVSSLRSFWADRIARITAANRDPHPLLEAYILIGVILSDQEEALDRDRSALFAVEPEGALGPLLRALRAASSGVATQGDIQDIQERLPSLVFSPQTRSELMMELREKNPSSSRPTNTF